MSSIEPSKEKDDGKIPNNHSQENHDPIKVFISYAHEDQELHKELVKHLSPLEHSGKISISHDQEISPGTNWDDYIKARLKEAKMILLLVSSDFFDSKYCWQEEVKAALERHNAGEAKVIPILLRPAGWQDTPLGQLQVLPTNAKPVTQWADRDAALDDVVQGIRHALHGKAKMRGIWNRLRNSSLPNGNTLKSQTLSLVGYLLLISFLVGVGLYFFMGDMPVVTLVTASLLAIILIALFLRIETISKDAPVKPRERRVLLAAIPLGFSAILGGSLFKERNQTQVISDLNQTVANLNQKVAEREKWLKDGQLTQLRIGRTRGDLNVSDMYQFEAAVSALLGIPVGSTFGRAYVETINNLGKGNVEIAWLGPLGYLLARNVYGARAFLCELTPTGENTYKSYIIANPAANIHTIDDLKRKSGDSIRKRFALTDPNSTSGMLIPLYELKKAGIDLNKDIETFYAGSHVDALAAVINGDGVAGAVESNTYDEALGKGQPGVSSLLVIQKSEDLPQGPVVARKDILHYDELRVEDAFFTIERTDPSIINTIGIGGFAKITDQSYDFLISIANEMGFNLSELK